MIPRLHLFELEDQAWFPARIRDFGTDYIHLLEHRFRMHEPVVPLLADALNTTGSTRVVDLCSGGGGPVLALVGDLATSGVAVQFTLTDRYPNVAAFRRIAELSNGNVTFSEDTVDARAVSPNMVAFRTMFNAFHHFRPREARAILSDAVGAGQPIGIFEIPERSLLAILPLFLTPLFVLIATPFIRPFSWSRLLWTYLVPIVPLFCLWDGLVSQLRAYSETEMRNLADGLGEGTYEWRAGRARISSIPGKVTWLIGLPASVRPN